MYSYIKGTITEVFPTHITLECQNIGYLIKVPNPYQFEVGNNKTVFLYQHVKEDSITLFGFDTPQERDIFLKLIDVKGLGPKGALAIIASTTPFEIVNAINSGNNRFFGTFPGIGPKLSQQIILDLNGKVDFTSNEQITTKSVSNEKLNNVMIALKSLGYNNSEIKNVTKDLILDDSISLSDSVKEVLKRLKKS